MPSASARVPGGLLHPEVRLARTWRPRTSCPRPMSVGRVFLSSYGRYRTEIDQRHDVLGLHARREHEHRTQRIDLDAGEDRRASFRVGAPAQSLIWTRQLRTTNKRLYTKATAIKNQKLRQSTTDLVGRRAPHSHKSKIEYAKIERNPLKARGKPET